MPQIKQEIPVAGGAWPALKADVLAVVKLHRQDAEKIVKGCRPRVVTTYNARGVTEKQATAAAVLESILERLVDIAVDPNSLIVKTTIKPDFLFGCFAVAPELTLAVITGARRTWFKGDSKTRRLYRWLVFHTGWQMQDGEIALAYERSAGGCRVSIDDVKKSRAQLHRDILRGMTARERTAYKRRHRLT